MARPKELEELLNRAYRYALSLTHHENDAFDLVQTAYLRLVEKGKPLVLSYLITSIKNLYVDQKRKEKVKLSFMQRLRPKTRSAPTFSVEPYLEKRLLELPVRNREILFLSVVEEYTAQEIADLLEIPRGTVLSVLHRTKKKLQAQLKEKEV